MEDVELRPLERADFAGLSVLYRQVFHVEKSADFWEWKYYRNPGGSHMMIVAIEKKTGLLVGEIGSIGSRILYDGKVVPCAQTCDVVISPDYQKKGIFFKMHELASRMCTDNNVSIIYGFSIKKTLIISTKKLGFKDVSPVFRFVKVLDPASFILQKIKIPSVAWAGGLLVRKYLDMTTGSFNDLPAGKTLVPVKSFDHRYNNMADKWNDNPISIYRDSAYLNWRYIDQPGTEYQVWELQKSGEILGFFALYIEKSHMVRAYVLEMEAKTPEDYDILTEKIIRCALDHKAATVGGWSLKDSPLLEKLSKKGFANRETNHNLVVRNHMEEETSTLVYNPQKWHLTMGDSDYH